MIWESSVWKAELANEIRAIMRFLGRPLNTDKQHEKVGAALEKSVFVSAFIIRKLMEGKKLSDELEGNALHLQGFPRMNRNTQTDYLDWHHIDRFYDFAKPKAITLLPRALFNYLIHSFVFSLVVGGGGHRYEGFLFNSDKTKDTILYKVSFKRLLGVMRSVLEDEIVSFEYSRRTGRLRKSARGF